MNWSEFIDETSERSGISRRQVAVVARTMVQLIIERVAEGDEIILKGLCVVGSRWRDARTVRSVQTQKELRLDGRYVPRFKPARRFRKALAARTPQTWRDPRHQQAWKEAESLVSTIVDDGGALTLDDVRRIEEVANACREAFGVRWSRVEQDFASRVPADVRSSSDFLAHAARRRWGAIG